jgi:hypothetical protein
VSVFGVVIPPTTRTLVFRISVLSGTIINLQVVGTTTDILYYNQPPYLPQGPGPSTVYGVCVMEISGVIDSSVNFAVTTSGGASPTVTVFADPSPYPESVFYNGPVQTASLAWNGNHGTNTILTGPARLLTASVFTYTTGTSPGWSALSLGTYNANSSIILATGSPIGNSGSTPGPVAMTFPDNTILQAGQIIQLLIDNPGTGTDIVGGGAVTYAYP